MLEVLHYTFLPDQFLDLALGLDIERIFVQQPHLILPLLVSVGLLPSHFLEQLPESSRVVDSICQVRPLLPDLRKRARVAQEAQPRGLNLIWCVHVRRSTGLLDLILSRSARRCA